jgi:hypothetical protein
MENAGQTVPVWGSPKLVWTALVLGCIVSGADALVMKAADVSMPVLRFVSLVTLPAGMGAQYLNWILRGGHSVTSPVKEFVLSLPFNSVTYWMLLRTGVGIVWILFPSKNAK